MMATPAESPQEGKYAEALIATRREIETSSRRGPSASRIHVGHDTGTIRILVSKFRQIEAGGAHEIVHLSIQMTTAGDFAPYRG
jgi:hypothetical protein